MKRSKFSEEQLAYALRQAESGTVHVCRQLGVSEATFYAWKKKYAHLGVSELRRMRRLEDENRRLKGAGGRSDARQAHAERSPAKKSEADAPPAARAVVPGGVRGERRPELRVGRVQPLGLVQAEHGEGSDGTAVPDSFAPPSSAWSILTGRLAQARLKNPSRFVPTRRILLRL
jgi:putative transposase